MLARHLNYELLCTVTVLDNSVQLLAARAI